MIAMKLNQTQIQYLSEFDRKTGVLPKACIIEKNNAIFFVENKEIGKAIGKKGTKIKSFSKKIKKRVFITGYSENTKEMIKSVFPKSRIEEKEKTIKIKLELNSRVKTITNTLKKFLEEKTGKKILIR